MPRDGVLRWWEEYVRRLDGGCFPVTHLMPADQVFCPDQS